MTVEKHSRLERMERGLVERVRTLETFHGGNRGTELHTARAALETVSRELEAITGMEIKTKRRQKMSEPYVSWIQALTDEEFENERFTVTHEAQIVGMSHDEAIEKSNALEVEAHRRTQV